jgi:hypothetical protein
VCRALRGLLRWVAPVVLAWACCLPVAPGQAQPGPSPTPPAGPAPGQPPPAAPGQQGGQGASSPGGGSMFLFEHILALAGVGAALIVVCMPSRKRF